MQTWQYRNPVEIVFGDGAFARCAEFIRGRRYVLVSYDSAPFPALAARLTEAAGAPALVVADVRENPDIAFLRAAAARLAALSPAPELIVALGGGSAIDAAKARAGPAAGFGPVAAALAGGERAGMRCLPLIAIPTTAGTGSEVTCWATVWDGGAGRKYSLADPRLYPEVALCDPQLTLTLPRALTVSTGLDALSHALESIWNTNRNPLSSHYAETAAREILAVLPALAAAPGELALRRRMLQAATFAGLAFSNTRTALAHNISYPITLRHGVAHGIACSFSLPQVLRWASAVQADVDASLARIFGGAGEHAARCLEDFLDCLGVAREPAAYGVDAAEWREVVQRAATGERGRNFSGRIDAALLAV